MIGRLDFYRELKNMQYMSQAINKSFRRRLPRGTDGRTHTAPVKTQNSVRRRRVQSNILGTTLYICIH